MSFLSCTWRRDATASLDLKYLNIYVLRIVNLDVRNSIDSWSFIFNPRKVFLTLQMLCQALFAKLLVVKIPWIHDCLNLMSYFFNTVYWKQLKVGRYFHLSIYCVYKKKKNENIGTISSTYFHLFYLSKSSFSIRVRVKPVKIKIVITQQPFNESV